MNREPKTVKPEPLIRHLSADDIDIRILVLASMDIEHRAEFEPGGWVLWVPEEHKTQAKQTLAAYFEENRYSSPIPRADPKPAPLALTSALGVALLLIASYLWTSVDARRPEMLQIYAASARYILIGEWYRAVTALLLHADPVHLAANLAGLIYFGTALGSLLGPGLGWLAILLSGTAGNLINAWLYQTGHRSIGASTALFGALGLLAGRRCLIAMRRPQERLRAWLPLGGGAALLGFLGSGANTDVMAHLFGFLVGLAMGSLAALGGQPTEWRPGSQIACFLVAGMILIMAVLRMP